MKASRYLRCGASAFLLSAGVLVIVYAGLYGWIQLDAHQKANEVLAAYPQAHDATEALILRMQSPSCAMNQRNEAVWTLGRLSDRRALPALEKEYTGLPCDHRYFLCQRELARAVRRCGGQIRTE